MYIKRMQIETWKSITDLVWSPSDDRLAGWHVIIGDNGSGKSSILKAAALVLVGPDEARGLRVDWSTWIQRGADHAGARLSLSHNPSYDHWAVGGPRVRKSDLPVAMTVDPENGAFGVKSLKIPGYSSPSRHVWSGKPGWFSAAYGPFRRFEGGDREIERIFLTHPRLARHLTVFGENVALSECLRWLQDLKFQTLENDPEGGLLDGVVRFVNESGLLPQGVWLKDVSSKQVDFVDGNGCEIPVEDLSDGFRSILSMTFELIRQLAKVYGAQSVFQPDDPVRIALPGVVLIDEVDAHLHPIWQRQIGLWFREHFPQMQFIVTTHSPLICQAADVGTVFLLPTPGTPEQGRMIKGKELERLLYGNVLDAYGTALFGANVTRSEKSRQKMARLAELNQKELNEGLSEAERKEQKLLRSILPTTQSST